LFPSSHFVVVVAAVVVVVEVEVVVVVVDVLFHFNQIALSGSMMMAPRGPGFIWIGHQAKQSRQARSVKKQTPASISFLEDSDCSDAAKEEINAYMNEMVGSLLHLASNTWREHSTCYRNCLLLNRIPYRSNTQRAIT
jgi:hypothetical protein